MEKFPLILLAIAFSVMLIFSLKILKYPWRISFMTDSCVSCWVRSVELEFHLLSHPSCSITLFPPLLLSRCVRLDVLWSVLAKNCPLALVFVRRASRKRAENRKCVAATENHRTIRGVHVFSTWPHTKRTIKEIGSPFARGVFADRSSTNSSVERESNWEKEWTFFVHCR